MNVTEQKQVEPRAKCGRCKVSYPQSHYGQRRNGVYMKRCPRCLQMDAAFRAERKCEHGRQRYSCKDCHGDGICEHDRQRHQCKDCHGGGICEHDTWRYQCKDCHGSGICEHDRQRHQCKDCGDAISMTLSRMIYSAKGYDLKHNIYNADTHIDMCFLESLVAELKENGFKCTYCNIGMKFDVRDPSMITIERRDNSIGHSKANCIICCLSCNAARVGQRQPSPDI